MDAVVDYLPSPAESHAVILTSPDSDAVSVAPENSVPLCALAFKVGT